VRWILPWALSSVRAMAVAAALAAVHAKQAHEAEAEARLHPPDLARANRPSGEDLNDDDDDDDALDDIDEARASDSGHDPKQRRPSHAASRRSSRDQRVKSGMSSRDLSPRAQRSRASSKGTLTIPGMHISMHTPTGSRTGVSTARPSSHPSDGRRSSIEEMMEHMRIRAASEVISLPPKWSMAWCQHVARAAYETTEAQMGVAALIAANFVISAVDAQMARTQTAQSTSSFYVMEWIFAAAFSVELSWNMFSYWPRKFWQSGWNVFDFVIVAISWLALAFSDLPGISVLRLFRAFRVFRLFKRIESLRNIIEGVFASLPAVGNAFVVLGVLMGIWSIIGVEFFRNYARQEFATFIQAMFTMWQIMTLDNWAGIARPLMFQDESAAAATAAPVFFVSFTFVAAIVMTNVVIAILLDNYLKAIDRAKEEKEEALALRREEAEKREVEERRLHARESHEPLHRMVDPRTAVELAPALVPQVMSEHCHPKALQQLPREALLDLAACLFAHPLTKARIAHYAHLKVADGKVPPDTVAGDLLRALAEAHLAAHGALPAARPPNGTDSGARWPDDMGAPAGLDPPPSAGATAASRSPRGNGGAKQSATRAGRCSGGAVGRDATVPIPTAASASASRAPSDDEGRPRPAGCKNGA